MSRVYRILEGCVGCGLCVKNCPTGAVTLDDKKAVIGENCVGCGVCLRVCKSAAVEPAEAVREAAVCNCCPVHCSVPEGRTGACLRYENQGGTLVRKTPLHIIDREGIVMEKSTGLPSSPLILGLGAGTNLYSAEVPSRVVGRAEVEGVPVITCTTESVLSFSGVRVKIDTDEEIGPAGSPVRRDGRVVGYISPAEYGSRIIYVGGAELMTGKDGFTVARTMVDLLNKKLVFLKTETVKELALQEGCPPVIDGKEARKMRVGCGSMIVEGFTKKWLDIIDEVIAVDYDVTACLSTHTVAGVRYGLKPSGIRPVGTYSSPGRYFGTPGSGWGGSNIMSGREAIAEIDKKTAWPGLRLLVTEPTAERAAYFELDENLEPMEKPVPDHINEVLEFIRDNCEDCRTNVSVVAGLGGGVRNVITKAGPLNLNRALRQGKVKITVCGEPATVMPGGGITVEADTAGMPDNAFAWVPTPAAVVPIELTMTESTYRDIGGYVEAIKPVEEISKNFRTTVCQAKACFAPGRKKKKPFCGYHLAYLNCPKKDDD
ncbi:4Fe-4S binding protein [Deltaproteobacteria bacterium OttesenSCG-928-M10]|nr:4Fe-4S binding protein [Deltaproteobacteria bacterium OttesenSCG-928-M10]